jgi:hypothetical protein
MASATPRLPELYGTPTPPHIVAEFHISEFAAGQAGSISPFGPELQFPLPLDQIIYTHPGPADRPHLADGR